MELWFRISFEGTFGMCYVGPCNSIVFVCLCYTVGSSYKLDSSAIVEASMPLPQNLVDISLTVLQYHVGSERKHTQLCGRKDKKRFLWLHSHKIRRADGVHAQNTGPDGQLNGTRQDFKHLLGTSTEGPCHHSCSHE